MLPIQLIRENPDLVRRALARRHTEAPLDEALALDSEWRGVIAEVESLRAQRNALSKEVGELARLMKTEETKEAKHAEHRRSDLVARSSFLGEKLDEREARLRGLEARLRTALLEIPNIPADEAPDGVDDTEFVVVRTEGTPGEATFHRPHWELGENLDIIDFERGVKLSGSRFYVLK